MSTPSLTQAQCEATADVLVLALYADNHISLVEDQNLHQKIDELGWDVNLSPSQHLNLATSRARGANSPEKIEFFLKERAEILETSEIKNYVFNKTVELLKSDGITSEENTFITQLKNSFGI